jgi:hypothetical protein
LSNLAATMGNLAMPNIVTSMQQLASAADGAAAGLKVFADFKKSADDKFKPASDFLDDVNKKVHDFGAMIRREVTTDHFASSNSGPHGVVGPAAGAIGHGAGGAAMSTVGGLPIPVQIVNTPHESAGMSSHAFEAETPAARRLVRMFTRRHRRLSSTCRRRPCRCPRPWFR